MRILYVNAALPGTGAYVHVSQFVSAARRLGHSVAMMHVQESASALPGRAGLGHALRRTGPLRDLIYLVKDLARIADDQAQALRARRAVRQCQQPFDFVYARPGLCDSVARSIADTLRLPLALEVNAPTIYESNLRGRPMPVARLGMAYEMANLRQATAVFAVSNALKSHIVSMGVSADRVIVTPNGVDHDMFDAGIDGARVRIRHRISPQACVVGFTGSFTVWQGIDVLVQAFAQVAAGHPDTNPHLLLIGRGDVYEMISKKVRELEHLRDRITLTGKLPHGLLPAYLAACDICVAPFTAHQFFYFSPLKLFEYMAMAKAIVASGIGQIGEVLTDGETGLLVEPGHVGELAAALLRLMRDKRLRGRLGRAARQASLAYTWTRNVQEVVLTMQRLS